MKLTPTEPVAAKIPDGVEKTRGVSDDGLLGDTGALTSSADHLVQDDKGRAHDA